MSDLSKSSKLEIIKSLEQIANNEPWHASSNLKDYLEKLKTEFFPLQRTSQQNAGLHLWLKWKAQQCREAGITVQQVFAKTIELETTPEIMKEIWRSVQKAMLGKKSTTELEKTSDEIADIAEHLNRFFAEKFNLEGIEFPSQERIDQEDCKLNYQRK